MPPINEPKLISGNANLSLAKGIARRMSMHRGMSVNLVDARVERFNDGEVFVEVFENVRGEDMYIIQPTSSPANDNLMELLIMCDALRRSSADRITAVIPYFGYARQDRRAKARTPISAKLVANLLTEAGVDRVLTLDLHAAQIQGFFDIPVDNLYASPVFALDIEHHFKDQMHDLMVVSPDVGGVARARELAKRINAPLAIVDKRREKAGEVAGMTVIGDVSGKKCIIVDDICDTAGTLPDQRMCVHTSSGNINGGWRCGSATGLNVAADWERLILQATPTVNLTVPGSNAPRLIAEAGNGRP